MVLNATCLIPSFYLMTKCSNIITNLFVSPSLPIGAALESALVFWAMAARVNTGDWNFQFLLTTLLAPLRCANASPNRDAYPNLAKCMAEVMRPDPSDQPLYREKCRLVDQMITDLRAAETTNNFRYLYMLCLGEVRRFLTVLTSVGGSCMYRHTCTHRPNG